jgi:hypothetical protein
MATGNQRKPIARGCAQINSNSYASSEAACVVGGAVLSHPGSKPVMYARHDTVFLFVPLVHRAAAAVFIVFAVQADAGFSPGAVPHKTKTLFPHIKKIVAVDVPLNKIAVNIGTGRYGAVVQHGRYRYTCTAKEKKVPYFAFVGTGVGFAAKGDIDPGICPVSGAIRGDKVQKAAQLFRG